MTLVWNHLRPNQKIRHANGVAYLIVKVEEASPVNRVWARWRNGPVGRFGKEVVQITPAHVRGFCLFRSRHSVYRPKRNRQAPPPSDG